MTINIRKPSFIRNIEGLYKGLVDNGIRSVISIHEVRKICLIEIILSKKAKYEKTEFEGLRIEGKDIDMIEDGEWATKLRLLDCLIKIREDEIRRWKNMVR